MEQTLTEEAILAAMSMGMRETEKAEILGDVLSRDAMLLVITKLIASVARYGAISEEEFQVKLALAALSMGIVTGMKLTGGKQENAN